MSKAKTTDAAVLVTPSVEIALNKLVSSKANVRRTYPHASVEQLAADILSHGLMQDLTVRAETEDGAETGKFEVLAGGRRLAALRLLAKQKKIAKSYGVLCKLRDDANAEELSLAENLQREALHPADEFEAFDRLNKESGMAAEEIAARFGLPLRRVKERLKLASVSPRLIALYREGEIDLEQVMAFTVCDDHARQEQVYDNLSWNRSADAIREALLESQLPAHDKRARLVGIAAYRAAGGVITHDLFSENEDDGYLASVALLDQLAVATLQESLPALRAEGWKWVEAMIDFPHGMGLKRLHPKAVELSAEDEARKDAINTELETLAEDENADPARIDALEAEYASLEDRSYAFDAADIERSGAIVSLDHNGELEITRGLITADEEALMKRAAKLAEKAVPGRETKAPALSDKLVGELSSHRTMAMRAELAGNGYVAMTAVLHALALDAFYMAASDQSVLKIRFNEAPLSHLAAGIDESLAGKALEAMREGWAKRMPKEPEGLWSFIETLTDQERVNLLALCAAFSIDAVQKTSRDDNPAAEQLASALSLDMRRYWQPTAVGYFSKVSKLQIISDVTEAVSAETAQRLADMKKADMANEAESLVALTHWLPAVLRTGATAAVEPRAEAAE